MKKMLMVLLAGAGLSTASGCLAVTSSQVGATTVTGEAWYVQGKGFFGMMLSSNVFYCPPVTTPGAATCTQAKMVPLPAAEFEAENAAEKANSGK
jgi:hypothetical protein